MLHTLSWSWGEISRLVLVICYKLPAAHYWIYLMNTPSFFGFLFASCLSLFHSQHTKGAPQSRKTQTILFTAINECWPLREFPLLPHNKHSCGQHPCSLSVVTFSNGIVLASWGRWRTEFWQNRSTKLLELLQFSNTPIQHLNYGADFSFSFLPLRNKYRIKQML